MTTTVVAPAKINLGLEILGRRDDGYHEIRSVLCTLSLHDTLTFEVGAAGSGDEVVLAGAAVEVPPADNLVTRALQAIRAAGVDIPAMRVRVRKRTPAAAGLGGASSDAAATVRAFADELRAAGYDPATVAASLGSDVPFFLNGPVALASGRGEILTPLPVLPDAWAVLVTPNLEIPDKTRTMYAAVDPAWWSDGARVDAIARTLPTLPGEAPFNVFEQALLARHPELDEVRSRMRRAGAPFVTLTGAGPTFYTLLDSESGARAVARRIDADGLTVHVARLGDGHA